MNIRNLSKIADSSTEGVKLIKEFYAGKDEVYIPSNLLFKEGITQEGLMYIYANIEDYIGGRFYASNPGKSFNDKTEKAFIKDEMKNCKWFIKFYTKKPPYNYIKAIGKLSCWSFCAPDADVYILYGITKTIEKVKATTLGNYKEEATEDIKLLASKEGSVFGEFPDEKVLKSLSLTDDEVVEVEARAMEQLHLCTRDWCRDKGYDLGKHGVSVTPEYIEEFKEEEWSDAVGFVQIYSKEPEFEYLNSLGTQILWSFQKDLENGLWVFYGVRRK